MKNDPAHSPIEKKELEPPSEGMEEFMSRIPNWTIQFGISLIFLLLLLSLIGSAYIRYPDVLEGELVLTSDHPTQWIQAQSSGRLVDLRVSNRGLVKKGEWLAILENSASIEDVETLRFHRKTYASTEADSGYMDFHWPELTLGEIQPAYNRFVECHFDLVQFLQQPYYPLKFSSLKDKQKMLHLYYNRQWEQRIVLEDQLDLALDQLKADSALFREGVIASLTYKKGKSDFLQKRHAFHGARSQLAQTKIQIADLKQSIVELKLEKENKQRQLIARLKGAKEALFSELNQWEKNYVLKAEVDGVLEYQFELAKGANLPVGVTLMSIVPVEFSKIHAIASIPARGASKIKSGQKAHIYLDDFIYPETGQLLGQVKSVSNTSMFNQKRERVYRVEIQLPDQWTSVFGQQMDLQQQMGGQVEIITGDKSVLEKLFYQIRKLTQQKP